MLLLYLLFIISGSLYGFNEKTIFLGGAASWDSVQVRDGINEASRIRPYPALVLSVSDNPGRIEAAASALDLALSFDEEKPVLFTDSTSRYRVTVSPSLEAAERQWARTGSGAALFSGISAKVNSDSLLIKAANKDALFAPGSRFGDFSLEFWLYPFHQENGEQIFSWTSSLPSAGETGYTVQNIRCIAEKNRFNWSFINFFTSPGGGEYLNIELTGDTPVVPKTWSHHLIRFDSHTGMIEYALDGMTQAIKYTTVSGHEGGDVFTPFTGQRGAFSLGSNFTGLMDEFRIYSACINQPPLQKFPHSGRIETHPIDLGQGNSEIQAVAVRGGRTSLRTANGSIEFRENGRFRFSDDSEMNFFIRTSENPYRWDNSPWLPFTPGTELPPVVRGRYVQVAVDFYPSRDGEWSPYLEEIRLIYSPREAPLAPSSVVAVASDGGVQLRWKSSPDMETEGYLVYYGTRKGEYFGEDAILGVSPVNAGKQNSIFIDGLKNGVLYYFSVAAYKYRDFRNPAVLHIGDFSREVTARPLEGLEF